MKPNEFDLRIIEIISAFRILAREKQANIASILNITQPEYSRIEKGERALTIGHLHKVCSHLNLAMEHLVLIAATTLQKQSGQMTVPNIIEEFRAMMQASGSMWSFGRADIEFVLNRLKTKGLAVPDANSAGIL